MENDDAVSVWNLPKVPKNLRYTGCRILNVMVESNHGGLDEPFAARASAALREYATAVEHGESGNHDALRFVASNGCVVKVIAGRNAEPPKDCGNLREHSPRAIEALISLAIIGAIAWVMRWIP